MIAVSNAVEPLRMANRVVGQVVYEWSIVSLDGRPVLASNGLDIAPTVALDKLGKVDILFVCGGINVREAVSAPLNSRAAPPGGTPGRARRVVHRRLRACPRGTARQLPRHDPLGKPVGAARGIPARADQRPGIQHRPRALHLLGRHGAARPDAEPDPAEARAAHLAAGVRAVRARARAQRPRTDSTSRCARRSAHRIAA